MVTHFLSLSTLCLDTTRPVCNRFVVKTHLKGAHKFTLIWVTPKYVYASHLATLVLAICLLYAGNLVKAKSWDKPKPISFCMHLSISRRLYFDHQTLWTTFTNNIPIFMKYLNISSQPSSPKFEKRSVTWKWNLVLNSGHGY